MRVTIDAGPILAGKGGISNYVVPLIAHLLKHAPEDWEFVLLWRVRSKARCAEARMLSELEPWSDARVSHRFSRLPDRLFGWVWSCPILNWNMVRLRL